MANRIQQDSFIDDSDETCPLCVEEFDISDRNFKPCPCGYQICQFCFNNIKNNMNGLCPACRRPYNDETIEWKVVSPEEFKADLQKQARKKAEIRQKEAQKREAESLNRKHLAGLRVVQKNLVYVVGLSPRIREEDLLNTLRGPQYFGQYGKIVKIVVSKSKDGGQGGHQPMGVYVTFAKKEDAERCIAAVDGSENGGRILRAQYGTTKYCSAYLRNETCTNKNCMFLHEPGEEKDSFTRQDLSSINVVSTQRPAHALSNFSSSAGHAANRQGQARNTTPNPQPLAAHPTTSDSQAMGRELSKDGISPSDGGDGSALPSSASWATKGVQQRSRRASLVASSSTSSPRVDTAVLGSRNGAGASEIQQGQQAAKTSSVHAPDPARSQAQTTLQNKEVRATQLSELLDRLLKSALSPHIRFTFAKDLFSPDEYDALMHYPPLIDVNGGAKLRARKEAEAQRKADEVAKTISRAAAQAQSEDAPGSGSLQLGGEPEAPQEKRNSSALMEQGELGGQGQQHQPIQPPTQHPLSSITTQDATFGPSYPTANTLTNLVGNGRNQTTLDHNAQQQLPLKSGNVQTGTFFDQFPPSFNQSQQAQSEQYQQAQQASSQGHARQTSRFAFANDSGTGSATAKPAANAKILAQQAAMMPNTTASQNHQHFGGSQYYGGSMPIPPPGLKTAGAAPVSGAGLFGHGQAFPNSFVGGSNMASSVANVDNKPDLLREMIRTRGVLAGTGNGHGADAAKHDQEFPALGDMSTSIDALVDEDEPTPGLGTTSVVKKPHATTSVSASSPTPVISDASQTLQPHTALQGVVSQSASQIIKPALPIVPRKTSILAAPEEKHTKQARTPSKPISSSAIQNEDTTSATVTPILSHAAVVETVPLDILMSRSDDAPASDNDGKGAVVTASASSLTSNANISKKIVREGIKRSPPGKLDIAAATRNLIKETQALSASGVSKSAGYKGANTTRSSTTPSATDSRSNATSTSTVAGQGLPSVRSTQPKTLRLLPTPKTETPPPLPSLPTTAASTASPSTQLPPQKQIAASSTNRPATPASETIVDTASQASAPISRTSSPPPSTVGSSSTRNTAKSLKNQRKKQRKEDRELEKKEVEGVPATPVVEEKEIAPIIGRKKKKAKQKGTIAEDSTPSMSRPPSPGMEAETPKNKPSTLNSDSPKVKDTKDEEAVPAEKTEKQGTSTTVDEADPEGDESGQKSSDLSAASIMKSLMASGELDISEIAFFKPIPSSSHRQENINLTGITGVNRRVIITEGDQAKLASGTPVHITGDGDSIFSRAMISPGGYLLRGLTHELEQRFLKLEKSISDTKPPMAFIPPRHHGAENGFYMVGGRVVQGGGPAPRASDTLGTTTTQSAALSKVRVQEALNYINQFVLPALPTHGKLDAANTNNPFNFKANDGEGNDNGNNTSNSPADTGRAPDPSTYTAYICPVSSSTGFSSDVSNVVHGMVAGLAPGSSMSASGTAAAARGGTLSSVPLLGVQEAEAFYSQSKKEAEGLEKKLNALIKKNRKLVFGSG